MSTIIHCLTTMIMKITLAVKHILKLINQYFIMTSNRILTKITSRRFKSIRDVKLEINNCKNIQREDSSKKKILSKGLKNFRFQKALGTERTIMHPKE